MIIRTKKCKLTPAAYIKIGLMHTMRRQWWAVAFPLLGGTGLIYMGYRWWGGGLAAVGPLYGLLRLVQFYGVTKLEQNQSLFLPIRYQISSQQILVQFTTKGGMTIFWDQIQRVKRERGGYILFLNPIQFIPLYRTAFSSAEDVSFLELILKHKKLLQ